MNNIYIGIDNGVSGSIGFISSYGVDFFKTPVIKEQDYKKKKGDISRIDYNFLKKKLLSLMECVADCNSVHVFLERPMVNPTRFKASISAVRALESTIIMLEQMGLGFRYIDSKEWQKAVLPKGIKGSPELKKASMDIGIRLYPKFKDVIKKQKDADGLLIAHWAKEKD